MPDFNFDRPYNEKCDLCEHGKDKHASSKYVCFAQDTDGYTCVCDQFTRKEEVKSPKQTHSEMIYNMAVNQEFGLGSDGICINCNNVQGGCEADAKEYTCEACGENKVYGATELVLMGY